MTTNNMQGMDTEHAREVANQMGQHAGVVAGVCSGLYSTLRATAWKGEDFEMVCEAVGSQLLTSANVASESINEQARVLCAHADAQDAVSS